MSLFLRNGDIECSPLGVETRIRNSTEGIPVSLRTSVAILTLQHKFTPVLPWHFDWCYSKPCPANKVLFVYNGEV